MRKMICYSDLSLLNGNLKESIIKLMEYGAENIELLMDGAYWEDMDTRMAQITPILKKMNVEYSIHPPAWDTNLASENKAIRETTFHEYKRALFFAYNIQAKYVVIHPGFSFSEAFNKRVAGERAKEAIYRLNTVAMSLGVHLAVENVGYHGASLFSLEEYTEFLNGMDENVGYLIDTGHAYLNHWDIPQLIDSVKSKLIALHLHDNRGGSDEHLPIGEGKIDWVPIYDVLKNINRDYKLVLEYRPGTSLERMKQDKEMLLEKLGDKKL